MNEPHLQRLRRMPVTAVLVFLAAVMIGSVALPASPASASTYHRLSMSGTIDIKDDDAGADDWCRDVPFNQSRTLDHTSVRSGQTRANVRCDEVRIEVVAQGQLQGDDRICNVVLDVYLYEGTSNGPVEDLDGRVQWRGEMHTCLNHGGEFYWDVIRVDNTAESRSNDHGWVRNLRLTNQPA